MRRFTVWTNGSAFKAAFVALLGGLAAAAPPAPAAEAANPLINAAEPLADAKPAEPTKGGVEFFETHVRPVLVESCYGCHSAEARANKKLKAKFYADSLEGLLKGGDSGNPGIVPGDPDKGAVVKSIRYDYAGDDESLNMPPKNKKDGTGGKLSPEAIKRFEEWVKMGAPAPKEFAKPREPKADAGKPGANTGSAAAAATDPKAHWAFTKPTLPALPAAKAAERASTDLDRFVRARLDAAGLAPNPSADRRTLIRRATFGLIGLPPTPEEVKAFAADPSPDAAAFATVVDRLLADGRYGERWARHWLDVARYADTKGYVFQEERRFPYAYTYRDYVIGAFNDDKPYDRFLVEQIAADQLDDLNGDARPLAAMGFLTLGRRFLNNNHDIIDDRIDVVTRGTMGLTVACARCHDHKFDPVPTRDYYGLHGVFASSTEPTDLPLIGGAKGSDAYEAELAKRQRAADDFVVREANEILAAARTPRGIAEYLAATPPSKDGKDRTGESANDLSGVLLARWRQRLTQAARDNDAVFGPWRSYLHGGVSAAPAEFERKAAAVSAALAKPDAAKPADPKKPAVNPLVAAAFANHPPKSLREVADRYAELLAKFDKPDPLANADEEALRQVLRGPDSPLAVPPAEQARLFKRDKRDAHRTLQNKVAEWQATSPDAPPRAMVLADVPNPKDSNIAIRGNPGNPGGVAPRRFLEVVAGPNAKPFTKGSGRLELARAIASRDNPLTARVFVNRVWAWHFGRGIVTTPSDFGVRSDPPSHPELLDYLAVSFMDADGWSVKKLHRRILLSATYQQASDDSAAARAIDPENKLLWRQNIRRLDFEGVRDTLLAVSGQLDPARLGRPVDLARPEETRRTIYGFIDRQNLPSMFRSFDFAGPDMHAPQRSSTTVPQQALFFLNSPFAQRQAKMLLARADVGKVPTAEARAARLYQLLYSRDPSPDEARLAAAFVEAESAQATDAEPAAAKPVWTYGYGAVDEKTQRVAAFTPLPDYSRSQKLWRGGKKLPDPKTGFVTVSEGGGHPGEAGFASVRRWTAPAAGTVEIAGVLSHGQDAGDGVRGRVVSSRTGVLAEATVRNNKVAVTAKGARVEPGDTIDFVVECGPTTTSDGYAWAPTLRLAGPQVAGGTRAFDAAREFGGPVETPAPAAKLSAWEKYAQVLMASNEFVFVD